MNRYKNFSTVTKLTDAQAAKVQEFIELIGQSNSEEFHLVQRSKPDLTDAGVQTQKGWQVHTGCQTFKAKYIGTACQTTTNPTKVIGVQTQHVPKKHTKMQTVNESQEQEI